MPYLTIPGVPKTPDEDRTVYTQAVSKDFFQTLEMPLAEGRQFVDSDRDRRVGIVNQTLARRFFGSDSAIGRFVAITKNPDAPSPPAGELLEIVGVVRDAKYQTLRDVALPTVFLPFSHMAGGATFMVRTRTPAALGAGEVRTALASAMPGFSAGDFRTQKAQIGVTFAREEHFAAVATAFAGLAIVLTAVGLYGLVSYTVARKTPEIGLRIALGASRRHVLRDVLRETITLASLGIALGLFAATSLSSVVGSLLFGLSAGDTWTRVLAIAMLAAVCMLAAALPARRAAFVDPIVALRAE